MPAGELGSNARKGGTAAIAEQERRAAEGAATPVPLWMQARRDEIAQIGNTNECDIGSIGNYNPDEG